jgi:hypothetical protein
MDLKFLYALFDLGLFNPGLIIEPDYSGRLI